MTTAGTRSRNGRIEAFAVIRNRQGAPRGSFLDLDLDVLGPRMPGHISKRLLGHAKDQKRLPIL
jgi:hypothetical protein